MIQLFYGNDTSKVRTDAFAKVSELAGADAEVVTIDGDSYQSGVLQDIAGASSLFGGETIYVLDTPSSSKEFAEAVADNLELLAESGNQFVAIEGGLLAADKKRWQKHVSEMEECKAEAGERFNTFAMADALARKDKKSLWLLLQDAKAAGQSAEEIIGVLWWQLKTLRLAAAASSASDAGLKDFPYNKAKRSLSNFKDGELAKMSHSLLTLYHEGHAGLADIDEALERWLLTL